MKALITGIAGFAGSHLAEYLLSKGFEVYGFYLDSHLTTNIDHIRPKISLLSVNLLSAKDVRNEVTKIKPDYVFHLAAFSSPAKSFDNPTETLRNNVESELNLLDALLETKSRAKILIVGSADEYGNSDKMPLTEDTTLNPVSPYAVSKVAQDLLGLQYFIHHKMKIIRVRPFNHIGPRQSTDFVVPSFASQIAQIEKSNQGELRVGNLEPSRDFTDVRDMVKAYLLALEKGKLGEVYNIGSGKPVKIKKILDLLISLSSVKIKVIHDKKLERPVDIEKIYCDFSKFRKGTSWKPTVPLIKTLSDTIEYERKKLLN